MFKDCNVLVIDNLLRIKKTPSKVPEGFRIKLHIRASLQTKCIQLESKGYSSIQVLTSCVIGSWISVVIEP
jgi:hypothetical protein